MNDLSPVGAVYSRSRSSFHREELLQLRDVSVPPETRLINSIHRLSLVGTIHRVHQSVRQCSFEASQSAAAVDDRKREAFEWMTLDEKSWRLHAQPISPLARFVNAVDRLALAAATCQEVSESLTGVVVIVETQVACISTLATVDVTVSLTHTRVTNEVTHRIFNAN